MPQEKMDLIAAELKPGLLRKRQKSIRNSRMPRTPSPWVNSKRRAGQESGRCGLKLKKDEYSGWIETDNGWYIIQLANFTDARVREVKDVREEIIQKLREDQQQVMFKITWRN